MATGNEFFDNLLNNQKEQFAILFEDKSGWYSVDRLNKFNKSLKDFIILQSDKKEYDLSYINFHLFNAKEIFLHKNINRYINFESCVFHEEVNFGNTVFKKEVNFHDTKFKKLAIFTNTTFKDIANFTISRHKKSVFKETKFEATVSFEMAIFDSEVNFEGATFSSKAEFRDVSFIGNVDFITTSFNGYVNFLNTEFNNEVVFESTFTENADFSSATFKSQTTFSASIFTSHVTFFRTIFENDVYFQDCIMTAGVEFQESICKKTIYLSGAHISAIDLLNISFNGIDTLYLTGYKTLNDKKIIEYSNFDERIKYLSTQTEPINANIFANKESVRLIKAYFEKQNNITEANKYFVFEQEKYIQQLKENIYQSESKIYTKLIPLYLNKYVSNFGTDWIRAILALFLWAVAMNLYYGLINKEYVSIFSLNLSLWDTIGTYFNTLTKMINPINAFKDESTFTNHEFFGAIVRIVSATIIYQIIISFRQFTRRG